MCGIAGGYGRLSTDELTEMAYRISHRGPDHSDFFSDGLVHLAHTRLSIIDLSESSNQPLWDLSSNVCIVFNGEIYNYKDLFNKLKAKGYNFSSRGDAEVILNLYLDKGEKCLEYLSGIFSFAIWDKRNGNVLIARDNYGVKPLYYVENDSGFYFSSEIKSLLCVDSVCAEVNQEALFRTLVFLWSPGEETLIKGVKKLKPAHFMIVNKGRVVRYDKYWSWPEYEPQEVKDEKEHHKNIERALELSVKEQLVADVEVGSFLSGGLDSSLIVAMARKFLNKPIKCFTIDSGSESQAKEGFEDDLPYAKQVSQQLDVELDILQVKPDITKLLPKMVYYLDELQADPAAINVLLICEHARKQGIKVLLSGAGGDDIFTGYRRHYAVKFEKYWSWLPKPARNMVRTFTSSLPKNNSSTRRIAKAFKYANLSSDQRLLSYFFWLDPAVAMGLFKEPDKISENPFGFIYDALSELKTLDPIERMLFLERSYFLVDHNFNYTDKMSMAAGVEVRVPFLDKRVLLAASKIPSFLKQEGKVGKSVLKKMAERYLPNSIIYRPKSGFGAPLRTWLRGELSGYVDSLLCKEAIDKRGIFNSDKVRALVEDDRDGKEDYSYPIFALICFEIWCQQFIDNERTA